MVDVISIIITVISFFFSLGVWERMKRPSNIIESVDEDHTRTKIGWLFKLAEDQKNKDKESAEYDMEVKNIAFDGNQYRFHIKIIAPDTVRDLYNKWGITAMGCINGCDTWKVGDTVYRRLPVWEAWIKTIFDLSK